VSQLFEILARDPDEGRSLWIVIAADAGEAKKFVPLSYRAVSCTPIRGNADGPDRLIGWAGPSLLDRRHG
jgi:hypothetical protein